HMLKRFHMEDARPMSTPLDHSLPLILAQPQDKRADLTQYQELIGSLNHLAVFSRPDISNAVSQLSSFMQDPTETHMNAARRVLRYLLQTRNISITYGGANSLYLLGFSDSNWGGDRNDRKSTTGYVFTLNNGPVSWTSRKQTTVAISS